MDIIFPYKHFCSFKKICNINYLIDLFTRLFFAKIDFLIKFKSTKNENFNFNFNNNNIICTFIINNDFFIDEETSIGKKEKEGKINIYFKITKAVIDSFHKNIKDKKKNKNDKDNKDHKDLETKKWNYIFYSSIIELTKNKNLEILTEKDIKQIFLKKINLILKEQN